MRFLVIDIAIAAALLLAGFMPATASPVPATEESVRIGVQGGNLSGTLLVPYSHGPFPVALIIAGSGPTDRDGNSWSHLRTDSYKLLADGLAAHGIASLRYDKRGVGLSRVPVRESDLRLDDLVNDALA